MVADVPGEGGADRREPIGPDEYVRPPQHYGPIPRIDAGEWALTITGLTRTGRDGVITWTRLSTMPIRVVRSAVLNVQEGPGELADWSGVPAALVVAEVPPADGIEGVLAYAAYGYSSTIRVSDLLHPEALLVTGMNGLPLPPEHGGPVRLLLPHLYGWKSTKWLLELHYCQAGTPGFWESRGYHERGRIDRDERYALE